MERKLILNDLGFPAAFNNINVTPPVGTTKQNYVEQRIIDSINQYNPKLKISEIIYDNIKTQFQYVKTSKSTGTIVEDLEIDDALERIYESRGYYIFRSGSQLYARRIILYVFLSPADEAGRNGFVSQTIFPTILDYAGDNLESPSYTVAGHKFLFINILNKQLTANMILRHIAGMSIIGIDYVETFINSIDVKDLPKDLLEFLKLLDTDFYSNYNATTSVYENDNYRIEFTNRKFIVKTDKLIENTKTVGGRSSFKGSSEKFYWIEMYPMAIFAYDLGYRVDYSAYRDYCNIYRTRFSAVSDKFQRCEILLKYLEKYIMN